MPDSDPNPNNVEQKENREGTAKVASPMQLVWRRFVQNRLACFAIYSVLAIFVIATYAPFIASDLALLWWDEDGISFPVLNNLFNKAIYPKPHDLFFNIIALLLPLLCIIGLVFRKKWTMGRRIGMGTLLVLVLFVFCMISIFPGKNGSRAVWDNRPLSTHTHANYLGALENNKEVTALFPLVHHSFEETYQGANLKSPATYNEKTQQTFWLGTDVRGRDVVVRMLYGARISLTVGLVATSISLFIGTVFGALSGYFGGWVDMLLQRVVEVMMAFPTFPLVMVVVAMTSRDVFIMMAVIGATSWAGTARLVRGEFLAQMRLDYVLAGRSMGLPGWRIMFRHVLPNISAPLLIAATFGIAGSVGAESGLAFIGLGDPNAPSWGDLMNQGRQNIAYAWLIYVPGLAIFAIITALNIIGEHLRQAMDVKS
ncbi:MAG: ABC transporter permease [Planctomycetes bacterium]|nr:ABC transporter permease [Planctomycetota bacterium]